MESPPPGLRQQEKQKKTKETKSTLTFLFRFAEIAHVLAIKFQPFMLTVIPLLSNVRSTSVIVMTT